VTEPDYVPLSAINQYSYCPRRCALIHVEGEFQENRHTLAGTQQHERVDQPIFQMKEGVRLELAMPVWSHRLRISGRCDAVEFHTSGEVVPVEYKLGKRKRWVNDDLQVAAQALCLEEMLGLSISRGVIFHHKSRRTRNVPLAIALRAETEQVIAAILAMVDLSAPIPPPTVLVHRCGECSLHDICQPELWRAAAAASEA
jgi:CRISPR-associated exonuclease Cas4